MWTQIGIFSAKAEFNKSKIPSSHLNLTTHLLCTNPTGSSLISLFFLFHKTYFCITIHFCLPAGIQYSNHHFSAFPSCLYSFYPIANTKSTTAVSDFFPAVWYTAWPAPVQHLLQDRWQLHIWVSQCCSSRGPCRLAISIISYFPH